MIPVGIQLILSILIGFFCLFFSFIFYNIVKIQSNPNKIIDTIIPVINEGIKIHYNKLYKGTFILIIILFILLTFIPQYNIKFATSLLLGGICALSFPLYINRTLYFLFLNILNKQKKNMYQFLIFIIITVIGFFSLSLPIIFCSILFFLFGEEENIQYIIGFLIGMGVTFIVIRISGMLFQENITYINKNIEKFLTSLQLEKSKYYSAAINIMNKTVDDISLLCSELFENFIFIILTSILIASIISPSELELLSNVSVDMKNTLMFLPIALSTVILVVFIVNAFILFLFKTVKIDIILKYLLYVIFFTLISLSFIIIFLYGLNIRVFSTFLVGSLIALSFNIIYSALEIKHFRNNFVNIFKDIFIMFSLLAIAIILSMYIAGIYGLSMMFFGFISYNGIFICEIIIYYVIWYINKIGLNLVVPEKKEVWHINNVINHYEKNPYNILPCIIIQTVNVALILLVIFIMRNNISLINLAAFYTIGGFLLGGSILSLEFILVYFMIKKDNSLMHSRNVHSLNLSINMGLNNIVDNFFLKIIYNCSKNTIVKITILLLSLIVIILLLFLIFNHNIMMPFILGLVCTYVVITVAIIFCEKMLKDRALVDDTQLLNFKNFCSIFGCDVIKFMALIILIYRFGF